MRHNKFLDHLALILKISGVPAKVEPRNLVNGFVPRPLQRDPAQNRLVNRALQGAIPDQAYEDPKDGTWKIVELKVINENPAARWRRKGDVPV